MGVKNYQEDDELPRVMLQFKMIRQKEKSLTGKFDETVPLKREMNSDHT